MLHDPLRSTQTAHRNYAYLWTLFAHAQGDASRATVPSIAGCIARCVGAMYTNTNRITLLPTAQRDIFYLHCNTMPIFVFCFVCFVFYCRCCCILLNYFLVFFVFFGFCLLFKYYATRSENDGGIALSLALSYCLRLRSDNIACLLNSHHPSLV